MFDDDEEELELLRQYENKDLAEDDDNKSSDEMDSDLEDKIMSMVQYGSGITKKKASTSNTQDDAANANDAKESNVEAKVVYAPSDIDDEDAEKTAFSSANEFQIDDTDSEDDINPKPVYSDEESTDGDDEEEEDIGVPELTADVPIKKDVEQPQITRFINMDDEDKHYLDDEETSEEETELGIKLQKLIDDQIYNRQSKKRFLSERPVRVCFSCHQPGHERVDCKLCIDCGGPKHKESRCLGARYCSRCKYRGHNAMDCENLKTTDNCSHCHATYHHSDMCPSLLHTYVGEVAAKTTPTAWCYNCTARGHYGDECPVLPQYKITIPSAFSKLSLGLGSRFDPKKAKKASSSYQGGYTSKHQRWSDSSREGSPRYDNHGSNHHDKKRARHKYNNDSDDDYSSRYNNNNRANPSTSSSSKNNNKKKHNNNNDQGLNGFFSNQLPPSSKNKQNSRSGNNNWKAMNNNSLPQPTRSGTVNVKSYNSNRQQRQDYGDFPRGNNNNNNNSNLPRPSSSGVIDLTVSNNNGNSRGGGGSGGSGGNEYSNRRPKYHGGYSRNR